MQWSSAQARFLAWAREAGSRVEAYIGLLTVARGDCGQGLSLWDPNASPTPLMFVLDRRRPLSARSRLGGRVVPARKKGLESAQMLTVRAVFYEPRPVGPLGRRHGASSMCQPAGCTPKWCGEGGEAVEAGLQVVRGIDEKETFPRHGGGNASC